MFGVGVATGLLGRMVGRNIGQWGQWGGFLGKARGVKFSTLPDSGDLALPFVLPLSVRREVGPDREARVVPVYHGVPAVPMLTSLLQLPGNAGDTRDMDISGVLVQVKGDGRVDEDKLASALRNLADTLHKPGEPESEATVRQADEAWREESGNMSLEDAVGVALDENEVRCGDETLCDDEEDEEGYSLDSVKRKRKRKMNKHKYRKRLKKQKFLRRKLGK
mmetsp:Transcript_33197/g.93050  ORF Transcript_33197/g.93050 Transcript_33197/m.93050 type:complete len:221 (+) Transcript_33197:122-784(+)